MRHQLAELPDDVLLLVLANLDSARDLGALGRSCRALHHLVAHDGWRIFVKTRFPSLRVPAPATGRHTWPQLAESLTWQSRCWDRRALQFQALLPLPPHPGHGNRRDGRPQGASRGARFLSVVDAGFDPRTQQELVVWGAGEDIVARYRQRQGRGRVSRTSWHRSDGKALGLGAGYDDVKAIKIVRHGHEQALITGRHNGQLALLSAEPDRFGEQIAQFDPVPDPSINSQRSSEQDTINSLDVLHDGGKSLVVAATKSCVRIYGLPEDGAVETAPLTTYDLKEDNMTPSSARLGCARWMEGGESIALALVGSKDPLRYLALTPAGWVQHSAAKSARVAREFNVKHDGTVCPNSLEPVHLHTGAKRGTSLLLSAWRDGTIRLQDLRTASAFDVVYQDNVDPWSNAEALLAYGSERFITGGGDGPTIKIFDFRWTKDYYHTTGLPCLDRAPFPRPHQPFMMPPTRAPGGRARCDHVRGQACHWHGLSRRIYYRPNAKYFLSGPLRSFRSSSVWSLARASDAAPNLYVGVSGGVVEASLEQCPDTYPPPADAVTVDPNFGFDDWRAAAAAVPESGYKSRALVPSLMEIGDGYSFSGNDRSIVLSDLLTHQGPREWGARYGGLMRHHRLDNGYQQKLDFELPSDLDARFHDLQVAGTNGRLDAARVEGPPHFA